MPTDCSPANCAPATDPPPSAAGALSHEALVLKYLRKGDTLTHMRCRGCLEEHIFVGYSQANGRTWLQGTPTKDTVRLGGSRGLADDIAIRNVTHINRVPVAVEFAARAGGPAPGEAP